MFGWVTDAFDWFSGSVLGTGLDAIGSVISSVSDVSTGVGKAVKVGTDIIGGVNNIIGATSPALESYFAAESIIFDAKQRQADYLAKAENYGYQAGIADLNGKIAMENLDYEVQMAYATEQIMNRDNRLVLGEAKANYSAAGVTLSGSAIDVIADNAAEGSLAVALMNYQSERRQRNYELQGEAEQMSAANLRKAAATSEKNAATALKQGEKSRDIQNVISIAEGISGISGVAKGVGQIIEAF